MYATQVAICQDGRPQTVSQNLSEKGTANCYIVTGAGDYYFDATVIGNGAEGIIPGAGFHTENATINVAAIDDPYPMSEDDIIEDARLENGKIYFHANGNKGNAVIYALNSDEDVIWTWHIWSTDFPEEKTYTNDDGHRYILMDRNLGATSANYNDGEATFGLYYQWGRKDPFQAADIYNRMKRNTDGSIQYSVEMPFVALTTSQENSYNWLSTFNDSLWGNPDYRNPKPAEELTKTIYDPCPVGYMVPPASVFVFLKDAPRYYFINGFLIKGDYGQLSFFPYAGRVVQGEYEAYGYDPTEYCVALWSSSVTTYNTNVYDGGSCFHFQASKQRMFFNAGDRRSRGMPVRCVKQAAGL